MATLGTFTTGIASVNGFHFDASQFGLVFDKRSQLPKRPAMQFPSLLTTSPDPRPNAFQVFDGYSAIRALRFINDLLADRVVEISSEVRFLAVPLLQKAFGRLRALTLKSGANLSVALSQVTNMRAGKTPPVRVGRHTRNPEVNAEKAIRLIHLRLNRVDGGEQKPFAFSQNKVRFPLSGLKQFALRLATTKGDFLSAIGRPDRNGIGLALQNPVVVGDRTRFAKDPLFLPVQLICVRDFGDQADDYLRGKAVFLAGRFISQFVDLKLSEGLTIPGDTRDFIGGLVGKLKRGAKGFSLRRGWFEL